MGSSKEKSSFLKFPVYEMLYFPLNTFGFLILQEVSFGTC
jgi:hypothetical protein